MVDVISAPALGEVSQWEATVPELQNGWRPTGGPVNPEADEGLLNWPLQKLGNRTLYLKERVDLLSLRAAVEVTVGADGQFETINEALAYLSERRPAYINGGFTATVRLLPGFVMREQVIVSGVNLGWIRILSTDAEVQIDRAYLTTDDGYDSFPAFGAKDGGFLPAIGVLFTMMATGTANKRDGIHIVGASGAVISPGCGIKSAGRSGLFIQTGGSVNANGAIFSNSGECGVAAHGGSRISFNQGIARSCTKYGMEILNASQGSAATADFSLCGTSGMTANSGSNINGYGALCRRVAGSDNSGDITVFFGSTIAANTAQGGTSQAVNTVTANGMIFK